jgi:MYXO-CTERM domain-containing protein
VNPPDGGTTDAGFDGNSLADDIIIPPDDDPSTGCCGAAPGPVAPGTFALGGLVMLLVRRRRVR